MKAMAQKLCSSRVAKYAVPAVVAAALVLLTGCAGVSSGGNGGGSNPPPPSGQLSAAPSSLAFGNVAVGSSASLSDTVTNTGNASVTISQAAISGTGFMLSGITAPVTLAAGQSATFNVTFAPAASGNAGGSVILTSNASTSTLSLALSGDGTTTTSSYSVNLSWDASNSPEIAGYNVYRSTYAGSCGAFAKLNFSLNTVTLYSDAEVTDGTAYCYATTAVNTSNEESAYSNIVSNIQIPSH